MLDLPVQVHPLTECMHAAATHFCSIACYCDLSFSAKRACRTYTKESTVSQEGFYHPYIETEGHLRARTIGATPADLTTCRFSLPYANFMPDDDSAGSMWNCEMSMLDADGRGWMLGPMYDMRTGQLLVGVDHESCNNSHELPCCLASQNQFECGICGKKLRGKGVFLSFFFLIGMQSAATFGPSCTQCSCPVIHLCYAVKTAVGVWLISS